MERRGRVEAEGVDEVFPEGEDRDALQSLLAKRLVFCSTGTGSVHALSRLVRGLGG
jgi:hypothetical protein